jgi:phage shock protein PspC (stress-responsive transcriptional regulator)
MTTEHVNPEHTTSGPGPAPTPSSAFWQRFRALGSLRRSSEHRAIGGVAEGLSRHFDVDPIIVRVLFVALTFFGGAGIILYLALWLTVPSDNSRHSVVSGKVKRDPQALITAGLAVGGIAAAAALLGSISWAVPHPFPLLLVVVFVGIAVIAFTRRRDNQWSYPPSPGPVPPMAPSTGAAHPGSEPVRPEGTTANLPAVSYGGYPTTMTHAQTPGASTTTDVATTATATTPIDTGRQGVTQAWWQREDTPPPNPAAPPFATPPPPPRRPKSHLFALTMGTIALAIAGLWVVDETTSLDPHPSVYPGTALGIIAAALLVSVWWGRSRGLIAMGVLASLLTAGAAFAGPGPYGDLVHAPTQASQLQPSYRMGGGQLTLRLESVADIEALGGRTTALDARFGRVLVIIPSSLAVTVDATVDHGEIDGAQGVQEIDNGGEQVLLAPPADGRPAMTVRIHLDYGQIQIERAACPGAGLPLAGESTTLWRGDTHVAAACS